VPETIGAVVPTQTCERSCLVIRFIARRPRWSASVRSAI
jgi:hypothetical protein